MITSQVQLFHRIKELQYNIDSIAGLVQNDLYDPDFEMDSTRALTETSQEMINRLDYLSTKIEIIKEEAQEFFMHAIAFNS
jgi:hypothetical protein